MKYYLAYGSNMNREQMSRRCPDAEIIGETYLEGYELFFAGSKRGAVASIREKDAGRVPVLIWAISQEDEESLDIYEGFPLLYEKKIFTVTVKGSRIRAMAYVMTKRYASVEGIPSTYYHAVISTGYREARFPQQYLKDAYHRALETKRFDFTELKKAQENGTYKRCPRCGVPMESPKRHALSRRVDISICDNCGTEEAIHDMLNEDDPAENWYCVTVRP